MKEKREETRRGRREEKDVYRANGERNQCFWLTSAKRHNEYERIGILDIHDDGPSHKIAAVTRRQVTSQRKFFMFL